MTERKTLSANYVVQDWDFSGENPDGVEIPMIQTYGCSCCSNRVPVTLDSLNEAIAYHEEKASMFRRYYTEMVNTGRIEVKD